MVRATNGVADFSLFRTVDCGSAIVSALNPPQLSRNGSSGPRRRESLLADNVRVPRDPLGISWKRHGINFPRSGLLAGLAGAARRCEASAPNQQKDFRLRRDKKNDRQSVKHVDSEETQRLTLSAIITGLLIPHEIPRTRFSTGCHA